MRVITDIMEFHEIFCPITHADAPDFTFLPDRALGWFSQIRLPALLDYCEKNSGFHLASELKRGFVVNRYFIYSEGYYLCWGDKDPSLVYLSLSTYINSKDSDVLEFIKNEIPAVKDYLDGREEFKRRTK